MLPKEYSGSVCELTDLGNRLIAIAKINVTDQPDVLEVYQDRGYLPILEPGTHVKLSLRNSRLGMQVMAGKILSSDETTMQLGELQIFANYEKRRFFRLALDYEAEILPPSGRMAGAPVILKDISLGGFLVESEVPMGVGDQLRLRIALDDGLMEILDFVVRREVEENGIVLFGCEFIGLSSHSEQRLCAFIFSQQQKKIRFARNAT